MTIQLGKTPIGLDGIPAAETVLSHVDGERGELIIAGEKIGDLARKSSFEGVTARLWSGATGQPIGEAAVRAALGAARERAFARLPELLAASSGLSIVDGFRAGIAALRAENGLTHEATIVGALPVIAGALVQRAKGHAPIAPDATAGHAADTLTMIHGRKPDAREAAGLDAYLVTVCDHGMNASTFATRVVASTHADLFASITAGYCALTGPLHGVRAGAGARNARCDRQPRAHQALDRRRAEAWRAADGFRSSHLPGARSSRGCAERRDRAARGQLAWICRSPAKWRPMRARRCGGRNPIVRSTPMAGVLHARSCSMRSRSAAGVHRRSSRWPALPAGPPTPANSSVAAG